MMRPILPRIGYGKSSFSRGSHPQPLRHISKAHVADVLRVPQVGLRCAAIADLDTTKTWTYGNLHEWTLGVLREANKPRANLLSEVYLGSVLGRTRLQLYSHDPSVVE